MHLILGIVGESAEPLGRDARRTFGAEGGSLGRSGNCDWQLPDPTNTLSARHAVVAFNGVGFTITDTSTNGVYVNAVDAPLGRGNSSPLADGDTLYLANYVISVTIEQAAVDDRERLGLTGTHGVRIGSGAKLPAIGSPAVPQHAANVFPGGDIRFPADPLSAIDSLMPSGGRPPMPAGAAGAQLPDPLMMFNENAQAKDAGFSLNDSAPAVQPMPFQGAPHLRVPAGKFPAALPSNQLQPDLERALEQLALSVQPKDDLTPQSPAGAGQKPAVIPDDFNFNDLADGGGVAPLRPAPFQPAMPLSPPPARKPLGPALANDLVALRSPNAPPPMPGERALDPLAVLKQRAAERVVNPARDIQAADNGAPYPLMAGSSGPGGDDLSVFWEALGLDSRSVPPELRRDVLAELGLALREAANGLHSVLAARALLKNEFQIEQTRIRSGDNNAFKFLKSGQDALRKSLSKEHGYLPLSRSVREGFQDIKAHEVAAMVAIRAVIRNVLSQVSPQALEGEGATGGIFGGRSDKGKLWDRFVELHASMTGDIDRTIRGFITEEFTRSYDAQVASLRKSEGPSP